MSNIVTIPKLDLPPALLQQFQALTGEDDLDAGVSAGFPVMSIKGAKWRIVEGGEEHPIYLPDSRDLAPYVKVVLLRANANISKTFYAGAFVEGSDAKPDCYSNDGITPAADAEKPQASACAQCPQNVWGSKISPSGSKIKACADVRRVAILPAEDLEYSPILLRIPGASLGDLAAYGKALKSRHIPYAAVVTKLSFDPDAAFPKILFQFERVLNAEELAAVAERLGEPVVEDILGTTVRGQTPAAPAPSDDKFGIPADVAAPAAAPEPAPEPEAAPEPAPEKPKATRKKGGFNSAPAETPTQAPAQAAETMATQPVENAMAADIDAALAELNL